MTVQPRSVLIVDDEPPARSRLRQLLEDIGDWYIAGEAAHGRQALDLCQRLDPDVVLLDIRMPEMDGIEVARDFDPVHFRHANVEEDDIRVQPLAEVQSLPAVGRFAGDVPLADVLEQLAQP